MAAANPDTVQLNTTMEKLLSKVCDHFDEEKLIDVTFTFKSNPKARVTAHRVILSASSQFFEDLFQTEEGMCPLIEIRKIDCDTFKHLIKFCYTGKMPITNYNVELIRKAASILQLDDAIANCTDFIIENISNWTLQHIYALEAEMQSAIVKQKIFEYEARNFMSITHTAEFLRFGATKLQKLLECDYLNIPTEKDAFEALKRWYKHDAVGRKPQLPDLITCLRLTQLDTKFLLAETQTLPGCELIILNALSWINCPSARFNIKLKYTEKRASQIVKSNELFLALNLSQDQEKTIFEYIKNDDFWQKWGEIKIDVREFVVIYMNGNVIFIGGIRKNKVVTDVKSWNCKNKCLSNLRPLKQPRCFNSVAALNNKIYVIGGLGEDFRCLKSVEMYCPVYNSWTTVSSLIKPRIGAGAVALNGKIYVMGGGFSSSEDSSTVECYNPSTDNWLRCADMKESRRWPGVAVHNEKIFVISGCQGNRATNTVESYDPVRNEWTTVCSLYNGYQGMGSISIDNQLWSVGGHNDGNSVQFYDENLNRWNSKKSIYLRGSYYLFTIPKV